MNESRLNQIDIAKGIGIVLVVIGHTSTYLGIEKVIYQFHMALFFILSGFFFKDKYVKKTLNFLSGRFKRLYFSYVINGLRLFILFLCLSYLVKDNTGFSFLGGLKYGLLIISGLGSAPLAGAIWFLRALFIVSILFIFLQWIINRIKGDYNKKLILLFCVLGFLVIGYSTQLPFNISSSFVALSFYYVGYLYSKNKGEVSMNYFYLTLAIVVVLYSSFVNTVDLAYNTYTYISLFCLSSISGTYIILFVSEIISQNYILEYLGQKSMSIMIFHFLSFVIINLVIVLLYDLPMERILDYPTIKGYRWWWLIYSVAGVAFPLLIDAIIVMLEKRLPLYFKVTFWFEKLNTKLIK